LARTTLTKTNAPGHYATTGQALTFTAADVTNGNQFKATGKELLIARNTNGATAYYVTISSVPDPYGRTGDISQYSIPADETHIFGPFPITGWQQSDGYIYVNAENAAIELAVVVLP